MLFCPKCSSILVPEQGPRSIKLVCSCGYVSKEKDVVIKEEVRVKKDVELKQKRKIALPKTKAECPKCGNREAFYWTQQTRSSDEPETRFFECAECSYRWREY